MIETPDYMSTEIARRARTCWMRIRYYLPREIYDQSKVGVSFKAGTVKAEAFEVVLDE